MWKWEHIRLRKYGSHTHTLNNAGTLLYVFKLVWCRKWLRAYTYMGRCVHNAGTCTSCCKDWYLIYYVNWNQQAQVYCVLKETTSIVWESVVEVVWNEPWGDHTHTTQVYCVLKETTSIVWEWVGEVVWNEPWGDHTHTTQVCCVLKETTSIVWEWVGEVVWKLEVMNPVMCEEITHQWPLPRAHTQTWPALLHELVD